MDKPWVAPLIAYDDLDHFESLDVRYIQSNGRYDSRHLTPSSTHLTTTMLILNEDKYILKPAEEGAIEVSAVNLRHGSCGPNKTSAFLAR